MMIHINELFKELQMASNADFLAIALMNHDIGKIKWMYAHNALNEKYKAMEISYGRGVAGRVMQVGTAWLCSSKKEWPQKPSEYPILMSEKIESFVAIPLETYRFPIGVLLIGYRKEVILPERKVFEPYVKQLDQWIREEVKG
ncbi:hypothetical protein [Halobacillus salinus]|uniref:hypothetical protein n=1 Tax=Halobacillus salinus TaxID=192814 RepID=UPI0011166C0D|nr:hypothetical protein [Halobacillus salinus]